VLHQQLKFIPVLALGLFASACSDSRLVGPTARTAYLGYMSEPGVVGADSFKTFLNDSVLQSLNDLRGLDTASIDSVIVTKGQQTIRVYARVQRDMRRSRAP